MRMTSILAPGRIRIAAAGDPTDKAATLFQLANLLAPEVDIPAESISRQLSAREELQSTAIGSGVAVPHARSEDFPKRCGALILTARGIAFGTQGESAHIVFGVIGPAEDTKGHLQLLTNIARTLRDASVRDSLVAATDAQSAYELLVAADAS